MAGTGFLAGSEVQLWLNSTPVYLKSVVADGTGAFATTVAIPADTPLGPHSIEARGVDQSGAILALSAPITVTAATLPPTHIDLTSPGDGSPLLPWALLGLGVLAGAVVIMLVPDRRPRD